MLKNLSLKNSDKIFIYFHLIFILFAIITLLLPLSIGLKLFFIVIVYNISVTLITYYLELENWKNMLIFIIPLSIFQIFPDWFLSAILDILVFPNDGFLMIDTISLYMAGLWTIPFFIILYITNRIHDEIGDPYKSLSPIIAGILALIIFGVSEATLWVLPSWYAQNVFLLFDKIALYILIPEILLGIWLYISFDLVKNKNNGYKVLMAFNVMLFYLGSASVFYLLIEHVILG